MNPEVVPDLDREQGLLDSILALIQSFFSFLSDLLIGGWIAF